MSNFEIIKDIARARGRKTTSAYDVAATVTRIEDGIAWCHIDGGVDETPVKLTIAAHEGDTVQVRVGGGTAWLTGNGTRPPTDDATANAAQETADGAVEDAARASEAAASAQESADIAAEAADSAQKSADNAGEYAARALGNLSTVQSVAETLTWITQHGTMTLTTDTELDPTHVYFVQDNNGDYVVGNVHYSIVKEPSADGLASYYVLSIDESLQNYVGTHLALTSEGLWILPETNGYKVLVATGSGTQYTTAGTYIIDADGATVAVFGSNGTRIMSNGMQVFGVKASDVSEYVLAKEDLTEYWFGIAHHEVFNQWYVHPADITAASDITVRIDIRLGESTSRHSIKISVPQSGIATYTINSLTFTVRHIVRAERQWIDISTITTDTSQADYYYKYTAVYITYTAYTKAPSFSLGTRIDSSSGNGAFSAIVGEGLISGTQDQLVTGKYNAEDVNDEYALIIGNGSDESNRSNALTVDWNGTIKTADGFDSSKPPYKWKSFVSDSITLAANDGTTYTVSTVTIPTLDGYSRFIIPRASKSQVTVTGWAFDADNHPTVMVRNLTSSSQSFTVRGIMMYLNDDLQWT